MGVYNSSTYRVVPLVNAIMGHQENFDKLLQTVKTERTLPKLLCPAASNAYFCGDNEMKLTPSKKHLIALVKHLASTNASGISTENSKRAALFGKLGNDCQSAAITEAINLIEMHYSEADVLKGWYIFEGPSNPDIYIEGEDFVIICEGKWTEAHITTTTTYLPKPSKRNQMVRHIQGALNATSKRIFAFYIVDRNCNYLSELTESAFKNQLLEETIQLDENERAKIGESFYGYTTWQDLQEAQIAGLSFLSIQEIDRLIKQNTL